MPETNPDANDDLSLSEVIEPVPELARPLSAGMRGHDVARLQLDLKRGGIEVGPIDGIFGAKTQAAVDKFIERHELSSEGVDEAVWAKVIEVAALDRVADLSRAATELEQRASEHRNRANALEDEAGPLRDGGDPAEAGERMEEAGELWLEGSSAWELAAELWIEAAHVGEPFAGEDGYEPYARWARATDAARLHAGRARTALGKAGEDLDASGSTDHAERIAAARAEARARAAH